MKRASGKKAAGRRSAAKRPGPGVKKSAVKSAPRRTVKKSAKPAAARKSSARVARRSAAPRKVATRRAPAKLAPTIRGALAGAVAAVARKVSGEMDAIQLLEADHRRMEGLLKKGEETTARGVKTRTEVLETLTRELNAHEEIEEKVLYPALQSHPQAKDIVLEGYQEHHVADLIVGELHGLARDNEQWGAKFKVLKENIEHHIEEEESNMFRTARGIFSREELLQLGAVMASMKAKTLAKARA